MRAFKFRAWDIPRKYMWNEMDLFDFFKQDRGGIMHKLWLENHIVMQFISVKDKNGREICEGDIMEFHESRVSQFKGRQVFQIKWDEHLGGFIIFKDSGTWWPFDKEYLGKGEIIGNIHANENLLQEA